MKRDISKRSWQLKGWSKIIKGGGRSRSNEQEEVLEKPVWGTHSSFKLSLVKSYQQERKWTELVP